MAKGTWKFKHRFVIYRINGAAPDTVEMAFGYGPGAAEEALGASFPGNISVYKEFDSESDCRAEMFAQLAAVQRYADARAEQYCQPFGQDATNPIRALTAGEQGEQMLSSVDRIEPGWKKAVNLANREGVTGGNLDDMLPEDPGGAPAGQ